MLIKYQALSPSLNKKNHAIYVLVGSDPYLLNDAAVQIKQNFLKNGECSQTTIDILSPTDWSLLISEANSYSLFSDYVLLDARFDKKSIDASGKALLMTYLKAVNERCMIILRAPLLATKSIQWLIDSQDALVVHIQPFTTPVLKQWVEAQFKQRELHPEPTVTSLILQYTQGNMLATAQLLEKLSLGGEKTITESLIREHLSDQSHFELYTLAEACLTANPHQSLRLLQQFRLERVEPTLILWLLTQEIRQLIQLHSLLNQSLSISNACKQLNIWSSREALYAKAIARISSDYLYSLLQECRQLDELIKTTQSQRTWDILDLIALGLCGVRR